jgi:hypothetical protein
MKYADREQYEQVLCGAQGSQDAQRVQPRSPFPLSPLHTPSSQTQYNTIPTDKPTALIKPHKRFQTHNLFYQSMMAKPEIPTHALLIGALFNEGNVNKTTPETERNFE